jgi:radical SAM superfamily enzyme YgiQ (UPF0313 family)
MMLGAALEKAGHKVRLVDGNAAANRRSNEQIVQIARDLKPDVIGMTLLTTIIKESYKLAMDLKGTGTKMLAGGPHASVLPGEAIAHGFDAAVVGEGETTIGEAVEALLGFKPKENVKGWVYRDVNGRPKHTEPRALIDNLDALPFPARHLVDPADYGPGKGFAQHANLFSSRGCSMRCLFCWGQMFGKRFRFRSSNNILDEVHITHDTYGTKHFRFVDDAMALDRERITQICEGLLQSNLGITWTMMTGVNTVDEELLTLAARVGCVEIEYGIESGDPETLKRIRKPHTLEMVRRIIPMTARLGIKPWLYFIVGFPWEDMKAIETTRTLMVELAPYCDCFHPAAGSVLIPFPGTEVYEKYKEQYGFADWWLSSERDFDVPRQGSHSYYESKIFSVGAVLDADFFCYSARVKQKIREVFKFMYLHNLRGEGAVRHLMHRLLLGISERVSALSPALERWIFNVITEPVKATERTYRS